VHQHDNLIPLSTTNYLECCYLDISLITCIHTYDNYEV
jgi:hypothetical protein